MTNAQSIPDPPPLLAVRLDKMVGRKAEREKLRRACEELLPASTGAQLFYIIGDGGTGKTRLLEDLRDSPSEYGLDGACYCTDPVDLYDFDLHSETELCAQIALSLKTRYENTVASAFAAYFALLERYRTQQTDLVASPDIRSWMSNAFRDGLLALSSQAPILILLDTAETFGFDDDEVGNLAGIENNYGSAYAWIDKCITASISSLRVMFVVAGRPTPSKLATKLEGLANHGLTEAALGARCIRLVGLPEGAEAEYFTVLEKTLLKLQYTDAAEQVRNVSEVDRRKLRAVVEGSPVALGLAIHFWLTEQRSQLRKLMSVSAIVSKDDKAYRLRQILVDALGYFTFGRATEAFVFLSLMRTGMSLDDLGVLWDDGSDAERGAIFVLLASMSFTKTRKESRWDSVTGKIAIVDVLYMHDEVADWVGSGYFAREPQYARGLRESLYYTYDKVDRKLGKRIAEYAEKVDVVAEREYERHRKAEDGDEYVVRGSTARVMVPAPEQHFDVEKSARVADEVVALSNDYVALRRLRRKLQFALVHYGLRFDPQIGYDRYFEVAQEAFGAHQPEMDARAHADFWRWWTVDCRPKSDARGQAETIGLTEDWIQSDLAFRWVQRAYWIDWEEGTANATIERASRLRSELGGSLQPAFDHGIEILCQLRRSWKPDLNPIEDVVSALDIRVEALDELRKEATIRDRVNQNESQSDSKQGKVRIPEYVAATAILGFARYQRADVSARYDRLDDAITDCTTSAALFRDLGYELDQSNSLNDKAYYLAVAGNPQAAMVFIKDAQALRMRVGYGLPIAYGFNTLALILGMANEPHAALHHAERALGIFRRLEHRHGEMLACRALSEILRRYAESIPQSVETRRKDIESACKFAELAVEISRRIRADPLQIADCLNECAAAHRDYGRFLVGVSLDQRVDSEALTQFSRSRSLFEEADKTLPSDAESTRVDILVNAAYLEFYARNRENALMRLEQAMSHVPERYLAIGAGSDVTSRSKFRWQLPKAEALRIRIANDDITKADDEARNRGTAKTFDPTPLLDPSIRMLSYMGHLAGAPRAKRVAAEVMYEAYKGLNSDQLGSCAKKANARSNMLGVEGAEGTTQIELYLLENFGV